MSVSSARFTEIRISYVLLSLYPEASKMLDSQDREKGITLVYVSLKFSSVRYDIASFTYPLRIDEGRQIKQYRRTLQSR